MRLMDGKKGLIFGVANERSLAWGIARSCHREGAELGLTYLGEALQKRVIPLAAQLHSDFVLPCDLNNDEEIDNVFRAVEERWGQLDFVVHSVAFAKKNELNGKYYDTSREGFRVAMETSVYSLTAMCRGAAPYLREGGSIVTLSYLGAERVVPHYNVMGVAKAALEASVRYLAADFGKRGIRVNAISAGPAKTLAASGIGDFKEILNWNRDNAPMRRNITREEVGDAAMFLLSGLASGITGEVLHVDAGYHIVGMRAVTDEEEAAYQAAQAE
ncbi:MAG: enoyl-ACP reductase [Magnetococcales bacterium]|nr:enoyl-ACP reductase [Magnetococcales bacterium]MBF0152079.1 enoyl-ACP reductase [Magnetococcales bacterium]MBF0175150.1 enoyl-ACP reductase [Magnetococcales bacterium]MBF0632987.1 enoyl-ACP reductase [Magnetococcales bacterium]